MRKRKPSGRISQTDLALSIHELLDIPLDPISRYPSTGAKIVHIILGAIRDALHRGESVNIPGFGVFKVYQPTKPHKIAKPIIYSEGCDRGARTVLSNEPQIFPGKKKVFFRPSIQLRAMLNLDNPTANELDVISNWELE